MPACGRCNSSAAPTLLQDYRTLENAIGERLPRTGRPGTASPPAAMPGSIAGPWNAATWMPSCWTIAVTPFTEAVPMVRRLGAPLDRLPRRRSLARIGPGQAALRHDRRALMNVLEIPWLELAILVALVGSPLVSRLRDPDRAYRWGLAFTGLSFACSVLAWLSFSTGPRRAAPLERAALSIRPAIVQPGQSQCAAGAARWPCCTF